MAYLPKLKIRVGLEINQLFDIFTLSIIRIMSKVFGLKRYVKSYEERAIFVNT